MMAWLISHNEIALNRTLIIPGLTGMLAGVIAGSALIAWASQADRLHLASSAIPRDARAQLAYGLEWPPRHPAFVTGEP